MNVTINEGLNCAQVVGRPTEFVQLGKYDLSSYIDGVEIGVYCSQCRLGICSLTYIGPDQKGRRSLFVSPCPRCFAGLYPSLQPSK
jgi:hypothetical protein